MQGGGSCASGHWAPKGKNSLPRERSSQRPQGTQLQAPAFYTKGTTEKGLGPVRVASVLDEAVCTYRALEGSGILPRTPSNPAFCSVMWPRRPRPVPSSVLMRCCFFPEKHVSHPSLGWALGSKHSRRKLALCLPGPS